MTQNGISNISSDMTVDNLDISGNTISSTDTNGDINLTTDGSGNVTGLGLDLITSFSATSGTVLDIAIPTTYDFFYIFIGKTVPAAEWIMQVSDDNGSTFKTSGYQSNIIRNTWNGGTYTNKNSTSSFYLANGASGAEDNLIVIKFTRGSDSIFPGIEVFYNYQNTFGLGGGQYLSSLSTNYIRLTTIGALTITNLVGSLYGAKA